MSATTAIETEGGIYLRRELPDGGLIEFEERVSGFRAYWYTAAGSKTRTRFPSVTTVLGVVMPKYGLLDWYEARGAEAALILSRRGFLDHIDPANAVDAIRDAGMGAKASAGQASDRGKRVHSFLETYLLTGDVPALSTLPTEDRGYARGVIRWLLKAQPEPVAVEQLVVDPERGYAGRFDARVKCYGGEWIADLKTNRNCTIYPSALVQTAAYQQADIKNGSEPALGGLLIAVGPNGGFREGFAPLEAWDAWDQAIEFYRTLSAMPSALEVR